jgi:nucleoporin p58/p45
MSSATAPKGPLSASTTQQQAVPGVRIDVSNIRGTTRFEDLHEELKSEIQKLDDMILTQISFHQQCQAFMAPHEADLKQIPDDVEFCRRKLIGMENGQDSDVQSIAIAAQLVREDADNAVLSFRAINNLQLPPQYHTTGMWHSSNDTRSKSNEDSQDIIGFFSKTADDLNATLNKYQGHFTEIENHLRGVEAASAQQINALVARKHGSSRAHSNPVEDLTAVLTDFESSLFSVADRVGGARASLREAQTDGFGEPQRNGNGYSASVNGARRGIY